MTGIGGATRPGASRRHAWARVSDELRRNGVDVQPVHIEGRTIARSFWGRRWCHHLEACSDFENRLPRGRVYVRNGPVCHLDVHAGGGDPMVVEILRTCTAARIPSSVPGRARGWRRRSGSRAPLRTPRTTGRCGPTARGFPVAGLTAPVALPDCRLSSPPLLPGGL